MSDVGESLITPGGNPVCARCGRWHGLGEICDCSPVSADVTAVLREGLRDCGWYDRGSPHPDEVDSIVVACASILHGLERAAAQVCPCSRCGERNVVNPRPTADLVVCEECAYEMGRAEGWDERGRATPQYVGPIDGHYEGCMGWVDCDCASYPNPYRRPPP